MKNHSNILRYPILLALFIAFIVMLDKLLGNTEKSLWSYFIEGGAFILVLLLNDVAEKNGWDTWSGLISKFKKNK